MQSKAGDNETKQIHDSLGQARTANKQPTKQPTTAATKTTW